jgi:hypothetical protein
MYSTSWEIFGRGGLGIFFPFLMRRLSPSKHLGNGGHIETKYDEILLAFGMMGRLGIRARGMVRGSTWDRDVS